MNFYVNIIFWAEETGPPIIKLYIQPDQINMTAVPCKK